MKLSDENFVSKGKTKCRKENRKKKQKTEEKDANERK